MRIYWVAIVLETLGAAIAQTSSQSPPQQNGFPQECQTILNNAGGGVTYPPTSTANSFNTFCPVIDDFIDCLERNIASLRSSTSPVHRLLAENFNKEDIRSKMRTVCHLIPDIATELECLPNDTYIRDCVDQQHRLFQQSNLTLQSFCDILTNIESCLRNSPRNVCPINVIEFYIQYQRVLITSCDSFPTVATDTVHVVIDSVFLNCVAESFPALIAEVVQRKQDEPAEIARIVYESFEHLCRNRTVFAECVKERFVPPLSAIDTIIDTFLNQNAIGTVLDQMCGVTISSKENTCLQDSLVGMVLCGNLLVEVFTTLRNTGPGGYSKSAIYPGSNANANGPVIPPVTATHAPPDYIALFCPAIHAINTCVRIQLQRCSSQLGQTFITVERQLLTPKCISAVSPLVENSPTTSIFMYCGLPLGGEIFTQSSAINSTGSQRDEDTTKMIKALIPVACKFAPSYTSCVAREIVSSDNIFDKIAQKFFDLTDANRLQKITTEICNQTSKIQDKLECIRETFEKTGSRCVADEKYMVHFQPYVPALQRGNFSALNTDSIRELCGPFKEIGLCGARSMSNCSEELAKTGETVINELLRIDCGGTRPLTGNPNAGPKNGPLISIIFVLFILCVL